MFFFHYFGLFVYGKKSEETLLQAKNDTNPLKTK